MTLCLILFWHWVSPHHRTCQWITLGAKLWWLDHWVRASCGVFPVCCGQYLSKVVQGRNSGQLVTGEWLTDARGHYSKTALWCDCDVLCISYLSKLALTYSAIWATVTCMFDRTTRAMPSSYCAPRSLDCPCPCHRFTTVSSITLDQHITTYCANDLGHIWF